MRPACPCAMAAWVLTVCAAAGAHDPREPGLAWLNVTTEVDVESDPDPDATSGDVPDDARAVAVGAAVGLVVLAAVVAWWHLFRRGRATAAAARSGSASGKVKSVYTVAECVASPEAHYTDGECPVHTRATNTPGADCEEMSSVVVWNAEELENSSGGHTTKRRTESSGPSNPRSRSQSLITDGRQSQQGVAGRFQNFRQILLKMRRTSADSAADGACTAGQSYMDSPLPRPLPRPPPRRPCALHCVDSTRSFEGANNSPLSVPSPRAATYTQRESSPSSPEGEAGGPVTPSAGRMRARLKGEHRAMLRNARAGSSVTPPRMDHPGMLRHTKSASVGGVAERLARSQTGGDTVRTESSGIPRWDAEADVFVKTPPPAVNGSTATLGSTLSQSRLNREALRASLPSLVPSSKRWASADSGSERGTPARGNPDAAAWVAARRPLRKARSRTRGPNRSSQTHLADTSRGGPAPDASTSPPHLDPDAFCSTSIPEILTPQDHEKPGHQRTGSNVNSFVMCTPLEGDFSEYRPPEAAVLKSPRNGGDAGLSQQFLDVNQEMGGGVGGGGGARPRATKARAVCMGLTLDVGPGRSSFTSRGQGKSPSMRELSPRAPSHSSPEQAGLSHTSHMEGSFASLSSPGAAEVLSPHSTVSVRSNRERLKRTLPSLIREPSSATTAAYVATKDGKMVSIPAPAATGLTA